MVLVLKDQPNPQLTKFLQVSTKGAASRDAGIIQGVPETVLSQRIV